MKRLLLKLFSSFVLMKLFENIRLPIMQPFPSLFSPSVVELQDRKFYIQAQAIWNVLHWNYSVHLFEWRFFKTPSYLSYNNFRHFLVLVLRSFRMEYSISSVKVFETSFIESILFFYLNEAFSKHQGFYHTTISITFYSWCCWASG